MLRIYLLLSAVFSLVTISAVALPFTSDGVAKLPGYHTHSLYTAYHYRPLCGSLDPGVGDKPYSGTYCAPAMLPYRQTSDTFAIYDVVGVRQSDTFAIGSGTDVCMCFSLSETTGKQSDYCVLVDANGQGNVDHGQYMRGTKSLPQCSAIDVASVTASLGNLGTQTRAQIVGPTVSH
ncbi:hypothetical protein M413DRAFT_23327 [Hebeloma cylindrosporum]|uniref:Uncharacterized protein n=1 Tax=Hebeloma cylindrosporum TaxID=76867 RepID=A0A0C3CT11_HEBCY|nr:hypothetical protein M413DRAFT_23327 [Hebeloma cylindrosporum h7]